MSLAAPELSVPVVAVDGPSGSGKGTVCRRLASRLGWHLLDSGALYRLVAVAGQMAGLAADDIEGHSRIAGRMAVRFGSDATGAERIELEGHDVTALIRAEQTGQGASRVAAWPAVRSALTERQRAFVEAPGLIADGRDMGTVIFPSAPLKIFLTASADERAERRYKQLISKGISANIDNLRADIRARDERDMNRSAAPLKPAEDAVLLDNSQLGIEESVQRCLGWWHERRPFGRLA